MSDPYRDAVIAAAEKLLEAVRLLPAEGSPREAIRAALERDDTAEQILDISLREYMGCPPGDR